MSTDAITYSKLAAALVIDGAIAMIAGKVQGRAPVDGVPVTKEERQKLGLGPSGATLFFPAGGVGEDGVFFDADADRATVWFNNGDYDQALAVFENALSRAYPAVKHLAETANASDPSMRSRGYEIDLGAGRLAVLDVAYSPPGSAKKQFAVRVFAKRRA